MKITRSEIKTEVSYEVRFFVDKNGGYGFPCDEYGNILKDEMTKQAIENYEWCLSREEEFPYLFNDVVKKTHTYREPAHGTCKCGEEVYMVNDYMGAVQCPKCGQWYNLFGQELLPPEQWEEDY